MMTQPAHHIHGGAYGQRRLYEMVLLTSLHTKLLKDRLSSRVLRSTDTVLEAMHLNLSSGQKFDYDSITQTTTIRLFCISAKAGLQTNTLAGQLVMTTLTDAPSYLALSYSWGAQIPDVPIKCNGSTMWITKGLAEAMVLIREHMCNQVGWSEGSQWLWNDQVCINQKDMTERSRRVQLMGAIYSQAVRTLVWLGPVRGVCNEVWPLIDHMYDAFREESPEAISIADIPFHMYSTSQHRCYGLPEWHDVRWQYLRGLLQIRWFSRTWVIQEVSLSRLDPLILHGQSTYSWERLGWVASWLRRVGYLRLSQVPTRLLNVDTISNIRRSHTPWGMDALLIATSHKFSATDHGDKVFGLLGLAAETQDISRWPLALRPDYELDASYVYAEVGRFLKRKSKSLALLTRMPPEPLGRFRRPNYLRLKTKGSWVPNWSDLLASEPTRSLAWLFYPNSGGSTELGYPGHYKASADLPAQIEDFPRHDEFRVQGVLTDTVTLVTRFDAGMTSRIVRWSDVKHRTFSAPKSPFLRFWTVARTCYRDGKVELEELFDSFIRTTTADQSGMAGKSARQVKNDGMAFLLAVLSEEARRETRAYSCCRSLLRSHFSSSSTSTSVYEEYVSLLTASEYPSSRLGRIANEGAGDPEAFMALARNYCYDRAFFVTANGRIGIGPAGSRYGDKVAVLFGGGVPYILRPRRGSYTLVGEAYMNGLMEGQAVDDWRAGEARRETFHIL